MTQHVASPPEGETDEFALVERLSKEHDGEVPHANEGSLTTPTAPVIGRPVTYTTLGGSKVEGYLSTPRAMKPGKPMPALLVIHEWWGLNANIRKMTDRLAAEGFVALAVDLYQGQVASTPERAKELMMASMSKKEVLGQNLNDAVAYLRKNHKISKIGTIGWCFGGGWSLQAELLMPDDIAATVIYYGKVDLPKETLQAINSPVLGLFGAEDDGIPVESVKAFEQHLKELGKPAEIHIYQGADHAFANPSGDHYAPKAAKDAWAKTLAFLRTHLGQ